MPLTDANLQALGDQLASFESLGYIEPGWSIARTHSDVTFMPTGGHIMTLSTREMRYYLSGLANGAQGRRRGPGRVQIIHGRDPDSECGHTVFVDDQRLKWDAYSVDDIDPGRGWERSDWDERIASAREDTTNYGRQLVAELDAFSDSKYIHDER